MTTFYSTYKDGKPLYDIATGTPAIPFDYGAGHVDPVAALDFGLVYDATVDHYISYLCALKYNASHIKAVSKRGQTCDATKKRKSRSLVWPS